ncbi:hypothetical protein [Psychromonas sp. Urea-02u-13]|nr:hypothetical protein [Psychromonas sp. Urea-02u-13]
MKKLLLVVALTFTSSVVMSKVIIIKTDNGPLACIEAGGVVTCP